jgi:predicted RNase H-like HicB family nuclease
MPQEEEMSTKNRMKDAQYYLGLRYPVMLRELAPEDGGGYVAAIPQLGIRTFVAVGETSHEALEALEFLRRELIPELVAEGVELPEPEDEKAAVEQYSGNLVLRVPRGLHAQLAQSARRNGCSINKLATQMLAAGLEQREVVEELRQLLEGQRPPAARPESEAQPRKRSAAIR